MPRTRLALLFAAVSLLAACAKPPGSKPPPPAPIRPADSTTQAAPPETPLPQPAPAPPAPATPAQQQQAARLAQSAVEQLETGNEEQALAEIQRALALDSGNKLAQSLLRQITVDPVAMLGREWFSYRVQPGETLSRIAGRYLGDIYSFYALARYNDIKVPRLVAGGQTIRVPGKAPPPEPRSPAPAPAPIEKPVAPTPPPPPPAPTPPPPPPAPSAAELAMRGAEVDERKGNLDAALGGYQRAASLGQAGASEQADRIRRDLVARSTRQARTAFAKQDLEGAIRAWNKVLDLDPANETAKLERQRAQDLQKRLQDVK